MSSLLNLTKQEINIYNAWFNQIASQTNPKQAAARFLALSGLPRQMLAYIWSTSGLNQNGIDIQRFYIVMRMVALAQQGYEPSSDTVRNIQNVNLPFFGYEALPVAAVTDPIWEISTQDRQYYSRGFHRLTGGRQHLPLEHAAAFFAKSGLPVTLIEQTLRVADIDSDNRLDEMQFIGAMHLTQLLRSYQSSLPNQLPENLVASIRPDESSVVALAVPTESTHSLSLSIPEKVQKSEIVRLTEECEKAKAETWRFSKTVFSDIDTLHVAKLLFRDDHQYVCNLEIIDAEISSDGIAAFGKMLTHNTGLVQLLFENIKVLGEGSFSLLISCLGRNRTVQRLCLIGCHINDNDIDTLSDIVTMTNTLREINLLRNPISSQAGLRLHRAVQQNPLHIKLSLPFEIVPGRESSEPGSYSENVSLSPHYRTPEVNRFRTDQTSPVHLSNHFATPNASLSSVEIRIKNMCMASETLMKEFAMKLSFNLLFDAVDDISAHEKLRFMHLQIPGKFSTCLLAVLSIESVRNKLLKELSNLSQSASATVLELGNTMAHFQSFERHSKDELPEDIFIRHKLLNAQYFLHTNRSLFAFYRSLHLMLCDFWLCCLLEESHVSFHLEIDYTIRLTAPVIQSVKKLSSLATADQNWIYSVSEEVSRRLSFRYESQIRQLEVSDSMLVAVCALYRILATLENLPQLDTLKDLVIHLLDQVGSSSVKWKLKTNIVPKNPKIRWNPDSVFVKPALAVISDGSDCDRWVIDDDHYSLWSGKRFRPSKYGYRICSLSELNRSKNDSFMKLVNSPPVSRWLGHHESIRTERQQHICVHVSGLNAVQAKVSTCSVPDAEQSVQPNSIQKSTLKGAIQHLFKLNSSRNNPQSQTEQV